MLIHAVRGAVVVVAASAQGAQVEQFVVERGGRLRAVEQAGDLRHEDGNAVLLVVRAPANAAAQTVGAPVELLPTGLGDEGDTPTEVTFTPDGTWIVIAHRDSRNLTVLDAATRDVLATISLSGSPNSVAVSSDGVHAVTANIFQDTASIVDLVLGQETDVVAVGNQPGVVRITPDGLKAVVGNTVSGTLSVIDIASATQTSVIPGLQFTGSTSINFETGVTVSRFTPFKFASDQTLLLPERFNGRVQFVDIVAGTVTPLPTAANPAALDVSADGTLAVVAHASNTQLVSEIDVASMTVTRTIPTGVNLDSGTIAIKPDKTRAVVGVLNEVRVIDTALWAEVKRVTVGTFPVRAIFSPDDLLIYVSNANSDTVSIVTNAGAGSILTGTIPVGDQPFEMQISPGGETLYVANFAAHTISAVALAAESAGGATAGLVALDEPVQGLRLDGAGQKLSAAGGNWSVSLGPGPLVVLNQSGEFAELDAQSLTVTGHVTTGIPPAMLAVDEPQGLALMPSPHGDGVVFLAALCPQDVDGDGDVGVVDLLALLAAWGTDPGGPPDFNGDGTVDVVDLLDLLALWGPCD